eukprot:TRINITY_DN4438_c0_g1_i3.p1 TRINITY_DN4438_c0_g1~~TRINITY_DN4438_c0_g1_i3.p1  ORF type:complete len:168 (-),score=6.38 TRINITY_DN4438_c0_g1_i3:101-604(-)
MRNRAPSLILDFFHSCTYILEACAISFPVTVRLPPCAANRRIWGEMAPSCTVVVGCCVCPQPFWLGEVLGFLALRVFFRSSHRLFRSSFSSSSLTLPAPLAVASGFPPANSAFLPCVYFPRLSPSPLASVALYSAVSPMMGPSADRTVYKYVPAIDCVAPDRPPSSG